MRKLLFFSVIIGAVVFSLQSCTKTCVCEDPNHIIKEIEVDPSENCSDRSGEIWGECS